MVVTMSTRIIRLCGLRSCQDKHPIPTWDSQACIHMDARCKHGAAHMRRRCGACPPAVCASQAIMTAACDEKGEWYLPLKKNEVGAYTAELGLCSLARIHTQ